MKITFFSGEYQESTFQIHNGYEILFALSNGKDAFVNHSAYGLCRGSVLLLQNMDFFRLRFQPGQLCQYYSLRFLPEEVAVFSTPQFNMLSCYENSDRTGRFMKLNGEQCENLMRLVSHMEYYTSRECTAYGKQVFEKLKFAEVLIYINSIFSAMEREEPMEDETAVSISKEVMPIVTYLQLHYQEKFSLDDLANGVYFSKSHMCRVFKSVTGSTIVDYLTKIRMMKAMELLREGNSVGNVGEMVGYHSPEHFIRTFTHLIGVSPKKFAQNPGSELDNVNLLLF